MQRQGQLTSQLDRLLVVIAKVAFRLQSDAKLTKANDVGEKCRWALNIVGPAIGPFEA
jgi:hypothetical protein